MIINDKQVPISLIAFDADDTLWDCQGHFNEVERQYQQLLGTYATPEKVSQQLFQTETANMPLLGYGSKAFTISLIENAIAVSNGRVTNDDIYHIIALGKSLLQIPATPLEGVVDTLRLLHDNNQCPMVVFTKGDNLDQQQKFLRSGLSRWFDDILPVLSLGGYAVHIPYPLMWAHEKTEVRSHPHLVSINDFRQLATVFGCIDK